MYHCLRDKRFLIKVPSSWRELYARGQKLMRLGSTAKRYPSGCLSISAERLREIAGDCGKRVVAWGALKDVE
jgi:hypothetical protein